MKKILIMLAGVFFFACSSDNTTTNDAAEGTEIDESVEIGAGEEISPQLDMEGDSAAFDVDTVSTTDTSNQQ